MLVKLLGPPGTGKTTTLSLWAKNGGMKYGPENMMICSLTRTAAAEIGGRDTGVPRDNIGTLHAHAWRRINDRFKVWGTKAHIEEWNDSFKHYEMGGGTEKDELLGRTMNSPGDELKRKLDLFRARAIPRDQWPQDISEFDDAYSPFKSHRSLVDFTDMIEIALSEIDCPFDYLIADEAQDYSAIEFALLKKWGSQCQGGAIAGDSLQALYEWRGASVKGFIDFGDKKEVLGQSWRVPKAAHEYAMKIVSRISSDNLEDGDYLPTDVEGELHMGQNYLINDAVRLAMSLDGTTMLLATCGYMCHPWVKELKRLRVPFHNPYRKEGEHAGTWNPLARGYKKTTAADRVRAYMKKPWTWNDLYKWMSTFDKLPRGTKKLLSERKTCGDTVPPQWIVDTLGMDDYVRMMSGDLEWFQHRMMAKYRSVMEYQIGCAMNNDIDTDPRIIVGTIHSVKGGEADNVILSPALSPRALVAWNRGGADAILRTFYVGVTRTRNRLYLIPPRGFYAASFRW